MSPPTSSTASAMSAALHDGVPLKSRCSRKCEAPAWALVLVARPGTHPHTDRHRADVGHRLGDESRSRSRVPRCGSPPRSRRSDRTTSAASTITGRRGRRRATVIAALTVARPRRPGAGPRSPSSLAASSASKAASNEATRCPGRASPQGSRTSSPPQAAADGRHGAGRCSRLAAPDDSGPAIARRAGALRPAGRRRGVTGERQRDLALGVDVVHLHLELLAQMRARPRRGRRACPRRSSRCAAGRLVRGGC